MSSTSPPVFDNSAAEKSPGKQDLKDKNEVDVNSIVSDQNLEGQTKLKRQLKNRHVAMISIGGVIGTGLFIGTAGALHSGGPVGLLLGYLIVGSVTYCVMISLGEMISYLPIGGGHITLAERFVDSSLSFAMGWNYWYNWTIVMPAELSAAALIMAFWKPEISPAVWIAMCLVVVVTINCFGARAYGEAEFWFASIKVITITGLIILGIVLDLGGGPDHDRLGFRYWKHPGPFAQYLQSSSAPVSAGLPGATGRFAGFWAVMSNAAFSYIGTEIVAIAAGETKNPRRNLPRAIKRVYIRILLFYIGGTFIIGLLVPWNDPNLTSGAKNAKGSPFVIAIVRSGIKGLPSVINAALLTSAWSAASSDLYTSSRALYGLALAGNAPRIFARTTRNGLPYISVIFCILFTTLSFMSVSKGASQVFGWFANMTSVAGLMTWFGISVTYIRFHAGWKAQGLDRSKLPFSTRLQPFAAYYAASWCILLCLISGFSVFIHGQFNTANFVTNYLPLVLFFILWFGHKLIARTSASRATDMDFTTGIAEIEADCYDEPPPKNFGEKVWAFLM